MLQAEEKLQNFFELLGRFSPQKNRRPARFDQDSWNLPWSIGMAVVTGTFEACFSPKTHPLSESFRFGGLCGLFRKTSPAFFSKKDWTKPSHLAIIWGSILRKGSQGYF